MLRNKISAEKKNKILNEKYKTESKCCKFNYMYIKHIISVKSDQ